MRQLAAESVMEASDADLGAWLAARAAAQQRKATPRRHKVRQLGAQPIASHAVGSAISKWPFGMASHSPHTCICREQAASRLPRPGMPVTGSRSTLMPQERPSSLRATATFATGTPQADRTCLGLATRTLPRHTRTLHMSSNTERDDRNVLQAEGSWRTPSIAAGLSSWWARTAICCGRALRSRSPADQHRLPPLPGRVPMGYRRGRDRDPLGPYQEHHIAVRHGVTAEQFESAW
jgi:hypothetical protein